MTSSACEGKVASLSCRFLFQDDEVSEDPCHSEYTSSFLPHSLNALLAVRNTNFPPAYGK